MMSPEETIQATRGEETIQAIRTGDIVIVDLHQEQRISWNTTYPLLFIEETQM